MSRMLPGRVSPHVRAREPRYPEPGFKASRLFAGPRDGDWTYLDEPPRAPRRNPLSVRPHRNRGPAEARALSPAEEADRERRAMKALRANRGCPPCVAEGYVECLRHDGDWWQDRPL